MTEPETLEALAGRLAPSQREAVLRCGNWTPAYVLSPDHNGYEGSHAAKSSRLFHSQLGQNGLRLYKLNDDGIKVREILRARTKP